MTVLPARLEDKASLLRRLVGDSADDLTPAATRRILGALYGAVQRELERLPRSEQLEIPLAGPAAREPAEDAVT